MPVSIPLVTIGIPTYNRASGYLPLALKSALDQDYPNLEIIVSDNASTDNTEAVVRGFNDPRIRYFRQEPNIGLAKNANFCVMHAAGTYFLLLHDDDLVDRDLISSCMTAAQGRTDLGIIRTGIRIINGRGDTIEQAENNSVDLSFTEFLRSWFHNRTAFYLPSTVFNTRAVQELNGFHSRHHIFEDVVTLVKLAAQYSRADVKQIKASFRRHDSNAGGNPALVMDWAEDCLYLRDVILEATPAEDREVIRGEATPYLCRKAYLQARNIANPVERLRTYYRIYPMFDRRYSPIAFMLHPWRTRLRRGYRKVHQRLLRPREGLA